MIPRTSSVPDEPGGGYPPPVPTDLHAVAAGRLAAVNQRYTAGRQGIVDVLRSAGRPLTISEIVASVDRLPQSSAYRTMAVLDQAGVVRRVAGADEFTRFELAEDLSSHHHHLQCTSCGLVADFELPNALERRLEAAFEAAGATRGFEGVHHRIDLLGVCDRCSSATVVDAAR